MKKYIELKGTTECPTCGVSRAATVSFDDAVIVLKWFEDQDLDPRDEIRGYRPTPNGFSFEHGGNYNVIDEMLGGIGDGKAEEQFLQDTGVTGVVYPSGGESSRTCRECARYL